MHKIQKSYTGKYLDLNKKYDGKNGIIENKKISDFLSYHSSKAVLNEEILSSVHKTDIYEITCEDFNLFNKSLIYSLINYSKNRYKDNPEVKNLFKKLKEIESMTESEKTILLKYIIKAFTLSDAEKKEYLARKESLENLSK